MSVRLTNGVVFLEARCGAEDAETLLLALQERPDAEIDAAGVSRMHLAVAQILLAVRPVVRSRPAEKFLELAIFDQL